MYLLYFINCNVSFGANFVPRDSPELRALAWAVTGLLAAPLDLAIGPSASQDLPD